MKNLLFFILIHVSLFAHGVATGDQGYIQQINGINFVPFMYLGAKHMVTGYDHILFLVGVIFFLYRLRDIGIYVTLFAIGHSSTLIFGVFADIHINAYIIDAIIGLLPNNVNSSAIVNGFTMDTEPFDISDDDPRYSKPELQFSRVIILMAVPYSTARFPMSV